MSQSTPDRVETADAIDNGDVIVLLARPRSGTNALRSVLETHPDICCFDEVFALSERDSEHAATRRANFFNFLAEHTGGDVERTFPDRQQQLFLDFVRYLRGLSQKRYIVIDVKYSTLHLFTPPYAQIGSSYFLDLAMAHGLRIFHFTRRHHLRYLISMQKAVATGLWEAENPCYRDSMVHVDVPSLLRDLENADRESQAVQRIEGHYERSWKYDYAEAFDPGTWSVSAKLLYRFAAWLGIESTAFRNQPTVRKQALLSLKNTISNYREVEDALRQSQFARFLEDEFEQLE